MKPSFRNLTCILAVVCSLYHASAIGGEPFVVSPPKIELDGNFERLQVVVTLANATGQTSDTSADLTTSATFTVADPSIVSVSKDGQLLALANGETTLTIKVSDIAIEKNVVVSGIVE